MFIVEAFFFKSSACSARNTRRQSRRRNRSKTRSMERGLKNFFFRRLNDVSFNCVVICHALIRYTHLFLKCLKPAFPGACFRRAAFTALLFAARVNNSSADKPFPCCRLSVHIDPMLLKYTRGLCIE